MVSPQYIINSRNIALNKHVQFYLSLLKIPHSRNQHYISKDWVLQSEKQIKSCNLHGNFAQAKCSCCVLVLFSMNSICRLALVTRHLMETSGGKLILPHSFRPLQCTKVRREGGTGASRATEVWNLDCSHHAWPGRGTGQTEDRLLKTSKGPFHRLQSLQKAIRAEAVSSHKWAMTSSG